MPKISCVIATRDRDNYIKEAIDSILAQTETDWELIVVDDHSQASDTTEQIINQIADSRIKYYKLPDQNGMGIACARNYGNYLATAEYIAVMDSDDICHPERFKLTLEAFANGADLVYGDYDYLYEDKVGAPESYKSRDFNLADFMRYDFIPHPTSSYRRQLALDFPYNSFFRRAEDYDFYSRLHQYGFNFKYIPVPLLKLRKHSESITVSGGDNFDYPAIVKVNRGWEQSHD